MTRMRLKLADFGLAFHLKNQKNTNEENQLHQRWCAPEILGTVFCIDISGISNHTEIKASMNMNNQTIIPFKLLNSLIQARRQWLKLKRI